MSESITIELNGTPITVSAEAADSLLVLLRNTLKLTGTKRGCDYGGCGACTVTVDGQAVYSCMYPAVKADGKSVVTIEGLSRDGELHPLQRAFHDKWAVQCGFCSAGMIMAAKALLDNNPNPSEEDIREALTGNLCVCTGYVQIVEAVTESARILQSGKPEAVRGAES